MARMPIGAALACGVLAGCVYTGSAKDFDPAELERDPGWAAVRNVPPVRQAGERDCGAAALAMVLGYWGVSSSEREILAGCSPTAQGIRAGALRDFARAKGLKAYVFQGRLEDLAKELRRRRPVIVGLVKPYAALALTHYEVVVGIHPEKGRILTLDPAKGWRENSLAGFRAEWDRGGSVTLVCFKPAESD